MVAHNRTPHSRTITATSKSYAGFQVTEAVRRVVLTPKGITERAIYDALSNDLAWSFLEPLDPAQRDRLVSAMAQVERLLRAGAVEVRTEPPDSAAAQQCLERYFIELAARFDKGFDPARSNSARIQEMTPPAGCFVIAWLGGDPIGCGALKVGEVGTGEVKRMWTPPNARGSGSRGGCCGGWK